MIDINKLNKISPLHVRVFARTKGYRSTAVRALTDREIAASMGVQPSTIFGIATGTWESMTLGEIISYIRACNFDPKDCYRKINHTMSRSKFIHTHATIKLDPSFINYLKLLAK